jgi:hypothetical protein
MKIFTLILLIFLFVFACSNDLANKQAPPSRPWATAMGTR